MRKKIIRTLRFSHGFTLIEIVVALFIIVTVGAIIVGIFYSTLRGTNKSNAITNVKRDGNNVLSQMTKMIRNAEGVTSACSVASPPAKVAAVSLSAYDGGQTTFICGAGVNANISSSSASTTVPLIDTDSLRVVSCTFTCLQSSSDVPPTIGIDFILAQKNANAQVDSSAQMQFQTSVTLRNLLR